MSDLIHNLTIDIYRFAEDACVCFTGLEAEIVGRHYSDFIEQSATPMSEKRASQLGVSTNTDFRIPISNRISTFESNRIFEYLKKNSLTISNFGRKLLFLNANQNISPVRYLLAVARRSTVPLLEASFHITFMVFVTSFETMCGAGGSVRGDQLPVTRLFQ